MLGSDIRQYLLSTIAAPRRERMADLPAVAERIDELAQSPPVRFMDREDLLGSRREGLREHRIGIRHDQDQPSCGAAQRLRTVMALRRGLIAQSEFRTPDGQPSDDRTRRILHAVSFNRAEGRLLDLKQA